MEGKNIEIPFRAFDSGLGGFEYTIPEGYEAEIKDGKVVVKKKESEDEKIRKWILDELKDSLHNIEALYSKDYDNRDTDDIIREDCLRKAIAWLEKQGEQKPAEISNICEFSIKTWIKIVDYVLTEHNGIGNYLSNPEVKEIAEELQKKYKFDAASEEWDRVYRKGLDAGVNKGKAIALREQKPAWSEEDERIREDIENLIHFALRDGSAVSPAADTTKEEAISWIQSLKDKVHPQPKQEWSEEDKNRFRNLIYLVEHSNEGKGTKEGFVKFINRLKSFKERVQPQPKQEWSEEDEKMLKWLCRIVHFQRVDNVITLKEESELGQWMDKWLNHSPQSHWKPAEWSKEDEKRVESLHGWLDTLVNYIHDDAIVSLDLRRERMQQVERLKTWLKSLKEKVQPQPKQEWGEEDRGNLLAVKCIIDEVWHNQDVREEIDHSGEELESLWHWLDNIWQRVEYPQNRRKPSDEQIEALEYFVRSIGESGFASPYENNTKLLYSLLEQLKKL